MNDQTTNKTETGQSNILDLASNIVVAFVSNSHMHLSSNDLSDLIKSTYSTLDSLGQPSAPEAAAEQPVKLEPAVSIRKSVQPDFLVCLEDGQKVKMLKRYIMTNFQLTPEQYRAKWNLPADYPMVAPNYSDKRRQLAKAIGLGTKGRATSAAIAALAEVTETDPATIKAEAQGETAETATPAPKRRGRKAQAETAAAPKRRARKNVEAAAA